MKQLIKFQGDLSFPDENESAQHERFTPASANLWDAVKRVVWNVKTSSKNLMYR